MGMSVLIYTFLHFVNVYKNRMWQQDETEDGKIERAKIEANRMGGHRVLIPISIYTLTPM